MSTDAKISEHEGILLSLVLRQQPVTAYQIFRMFEQSPTTSINASKGTAGLLLRDTTLYANLVGITRGADSLMRSLTSGQGTASRLLTDQTLYDQLNKLVSDLRAVIADVRRDPSRYTKGMVKVF